MLELEPKHKTFIQKSTHIIDLVSSYLLSIFLDYKILFRVLESVLKK